MNPLDRRTAGADRNAPAVVSERSRELREEGAYAVLATAKQLEAQGRDIVHMEIGEPDFPTPSPIAMAGIRAIQEGHTRYNPPAGLPDLRRELAREAGIFRGMEIRPEQVVVAPGAKPILFLALVATIEPGDEVICPDPGFPSYEAAVRLAGGVPVFVPLDRRRGFDLNVDALAEVMSPRTRVILLNSPGNPTGGVLTAEALSRVADLAMGHGCWVISDEIYSKLLYAEVPVTPAALPGMAERTVIVDGFSKTYSMTGWRLGYGIVPQALVRPMERLLTHTVGCTATFTQMAGTAAISGSHAAVDDMGERFRRRRDAMVEGLNRIPGFHCHRPQGAFYAFPNVEGVGRDDGWLASYLLEEAGVALLPGNGFGANGAGHLRLSYAHSIDTIQKGLGRIRAAIEKLA